MNGHTGGYYPQTQKLESQNMIYSLILRVQELIHGAQYKKTFGFWIHRKNIIISIYLEGCTIGGGAGAAGGGNPAGVACATGAR